MMVALANAWTQSSAHGQDPVIPYTRIEEDWELVIGEPDPDTHAPQVVNIISPWGDVSRDYAIFEINHSTQPEYLEGGVQLQLWRDERYYSNAGPYDCTLLSTPGETVTYTLSMAIYNGYLFVKVRNGSSLTWNSFGESSLILSCPARMPDLSNYTTNISSSKSRVAFAAHRVEKFALKKVRYYLNGELVKTDDTPRQIHPPVE